MKQRTQPIVVYCEVNLLINLSLKRKTLKLYKVKTDFDKFHVVSSKTGGVENVTTVAIISILNSI